MQAAEMRRLGLPTWEDVVALLRSDKLRSYRIDVETDQTSMVDEQAEKESRLEFLKVMQEMLAGAYQAIGAAPTMLPLVKEMFMYAVRSFRAGRALEESFETAFDELEKNPPPPPQKEDPNAGKAALDQLRNQIAQLEVQRKTAKDQADNQLAMAELQAQVSKDRADIMIAMQELKLRGIEVMKPEPQKAVAPPPPPQPPSRSIAFKDLPPEGQSQLAAQAGIQIDPQRMADHNAEQAAQQMAMKKPAPPPIGGA